jgi:diphthamide biosynthesis protein 4
MAHRDNDIKGYATMTHYQVLDINPNFIEPQGLKRAYHKALLKHHPDKSLPSSASTSSVDAIKLAYKILSDPVTRASYDKEALATSSTKDEATESYRTGEEIVDLDDLEYDEAEEKWFRACRCGEERGFVVTEDQLEKEDMNGNREVLVGCIGCSLWLRVGFSIVEDQEHSK